MQHSVLDSILMYISNCSWYLWVFVVLFLLLNIVGEILRWHLLTLIQYKVFFSSFFFRLNDHRLDISCSMACLLLASFYSFDRKSLKTFSKHVYASNLSKSTLFTRFSPQLLLAVGTKLEHIITDLAHEVAEKHIAVEGDLVVRPSDDLFWFQSPRLVLFLIHFILFQNSFEIAYFFFILVSTLYH